MRVIIDRFEEEYAVVELDGEMMPAPRALFAGAREGDHVEITVIGKPHRESPSAQPDALSEDSPETESVSADHMEESVSDSVSEEDPHSIFERLRAKRRGRE